MGNDTKQAGGERKVPTRRMAFEEALATVPKHFSEGGDLIGSHLTAVLSSYFPDGEDFFVRSVRHFRDDVTDPELKAEVRGFIGQEAIHGREHRAFNDHLATLGYPTHTIERFIDRFLRLREKVLPAKANLAFTAAAEHFTATLAELVLSSEQARAEFGDETVRELFVWHALEENEHKAVAFDVYRAVGGTERMRIWTMKALRLMFSSSVGTFVVGSLLTDKATYKPGNLRRSLKKLKASPLTDKAVWQALCEYDRKGFHPNDRDTTALIAEWRERLFGDHGTLNDKLAGRAA
jgi:predicted metal-dependent hydrolase